MNNLYQTNRKIVMDLVTELIKEDYLRKDDVLKIMEKHVIGTREEERIKMESWYKTLGIERIIKRPFSLSAPYFTDKEMQEIRENDEYLICVPAGITAQQLSDLFHMPSWACSSGLVTQFPETEDFWFATSKQTLPGYLDRSGFEAMKQLKKENKLNMSLERYLVYCAYVYRVTGALPDQKYKVWLPNSRYEGKGMLIAGIDSAGDFAINGWLPQFHSPLVGVRYVRIADHL